jgi:hypothetical protein
MDIQYRDADGCKTMMGERCVVQEALFYAFSLDRHVPADHLLWAIVRFRGSF